MITLTLPSPMLLFKRLFAAVQEERRSLRQRRAKRQWSLGVRVFACLRDAPVTPTVCFFFLIKFVATAGRTLQEQPRTSLVDISGGTTKQQPNVAGSLLLQWMLTSVE